MQQDNISPTKGAWLWSRDCFKILPLVVMQRDARVCQRQLSYLSVVRIYRKAYISFTAATRFIATSPCASNNHVLVLCHCDEEREP